MTKGLFSFVVVCAVTVACGTAGGTAVRDADAGGVTVDPAEVRVEGTFQTRPPD
jgi:hypothetical protein